MPPSRSPTSEEIKAGLERARAAGKKLGRPRSGREDDVERLILNGWRAEDVRKHLRVGTQVIRRVMARLKEQGLK